jgi:ribosome biogenesis GTPase
LDRLQLLGWDAHFETAFRLLKRDAWQPARVIEEQRGRLRVATGVEACWGRLAGRFRHEAADHLELPAVGDWVLVSKSEHAGAEATVHQLLPRKSGLVRRAAQRAVVAQVVAANIDTVLLVMSLNRDFSPRRIERYLAMIGDSGARPVILLNKIDLCTDVAAALAGIGTTAAGVAVHPISALLGQGLDALSQYFAPGRTVAVIGSSGVGKSTVINRILGEERQLVRAIRKSDDRGCHTTTSRHLLEVPSGGMLIDTPGMRELGLWESAEGLDQAFREIRDLQAACRFRDCRHGQEPGCAVRLAMEEGQLDPARYASYCKLQREQAFVASKQDQKARVANKRKWRQMTKSHKQRARSDPRIRGKRGG